MEITQTRLGLYPIGWEYLAYHQDRVYRFSMPILSVAEWNGHPSGQSILLGKSVRRVGSFNHFGLLDAPLDVIRRAVRHALIDAEGYRAEAVAVQNADGLVARVLAHEGFSQEQNLHYRMLREGQPVQEQPSWDYVIGL